MYKGYLTDVKGLKVGHMTDLDNMTGVTVVLCGEEGCTGGIDVRGSAPGTRETDIFDTKKSVDRVHSVVLTGGSAYGTEASLGVMEYLEEKDIGFDVGVTKVPIVPTAAIFDLSLGSPFVRPDKKMGYEAAKNASENEMAQGNVGAGTGASVGKVNGPDYIMKGGLGSASIKLGDLVVSAIVSVNAVGDIFDYKTGRQIAGVFDRKDKKLLNGYELMKESSRRIGFERFNENTNTTIGIVATNAKLNKAFANKMAEMAHNGFARSINPIHTMSDGDTIFSLATNEVAADLNLVGSLASEVMSRAITNAIINAETYKDIPSYKDIKEFID